MRKTIVYLMIAALFCSMGLSAHAAGGISLTATEPRAGETVSIVVTLEESLTGDTLGIAFSYDEAVMEPVTDGFTWLRKGALSDFRFSKSQGVWASEEPMDLQGDVCVLVFQLLEGFEQSQVDVTLMVKNGAQVLGQFDAAVELALRCDHSYGPWTDDGELGHVRVCALCDGRQTQSHEWGSEVLTPDPENPNQNISTRTCSVCAAVKTLAVPGENKPTEPTVPQPTEPEETKPTQPEPTAPTEPEPTESQPHVPTTPGTEPTNPAPTNPAVSDPTAPEEDHRETEPQVQPTHTGATEEPQDHSHPAGTEVTQDAPSQPETAPTEEGVATESTAVIEETEEEPEQPSGLGLLLAVPVLAVAGWFLIRRKRKSENEAE